MNEQTKPIQFKLRRLPEENYFNEPVDWNVGLIAEKAPEDQGNFYVVWTGQCEPFLEPELIEARPDLWERIN